ncbi:MAG: WecB/TagA/CpsF family glycosyltransferase [Treponema sp.]|nr:WecB/TagA/CpsF family glycosyltransferase [Treponema sp.]
MDSRPGLRRIAILGVPIDIIPAERLDDLVASFEDGINHQIILLSVWDLMRARNRVEFKTMVAGADLVVPISASIVKAARFLRHPEPPRYQPFDFIIRLLGILERSGKSAYLLGGSPRIVLKAEGNLRTTFPGLRLVGRHAGAYPRQREPAIVEAIRKASPTLLLVGKGTPGGERWIPRNLPSFPSGIYLWCSDIFWVFAHERSKPSPSIVAHGLDWIPAFLRRPWTIWRLPIFALFKILILFERLSQR